MAVRTRMLALMPSIAVQTWTNAFTVPVDRTAIVKHVAITNTTGAARDVLLRVRSGSANAQVLRVQGLAAGASYEATRWELAINPGDSIEVWHSNANASTALSLVLAGALLAGAPE